MEGPRACKKDEIQQVISLTNETFRNSPGMFKTMHKEFPLLLSEKNLDNMRVISVDGEIAADVNYYPTMMDIEGSRIKAASIGAVCTDDKHRGKGYASIILDDIEKRLYKNKTHLLFVSGGRSLYIRRGCTFCGKFYELKINKEMLNEIPVLSSMKVEELADYNAEMFINLYNRDSSRFIRSYEEFNSLYSGATTVWGDFYYKTYVVKLQDEYIAYFIIRVRKNENNKPYGIMVEYAGDINGIIKGIKEAANLNDLDEVMIRSEYRDAMSSYLLSLNASHKEINQLGTVKIIHFTDFMNSLSDYFKQRLTSEQFNKLSFYEEGSDKVIRYKEEIILLKSTQSEKLILGEWEDIKSNWDISLEFKDVLDKIFPIHIPWVGNLNYQ